MMPSLDFETYSAAGFATSPAGKVVGVGSQGKGGLSVVGTAAYFEHPSTRILSLSYDLKDGRGVRRWAPGWPDPLDLIEHVMAGRPLEAWNATFEFWAWNMICTRQFGWPALPLQQLYCAMAKARRFNLPGSLKEAAKVLGTAQKDPAGENLIQKLCRPHTPTKNRADIRWTPQTAPEDFARLYDYNDQDVRAEDEASARIPDLSAIEREVWLADQTVNARGVQVDVETLDAALDVLAATEARFTLELATLTAGEVGSASEVAKFGRWLSGRGVHLPDLTSDTVDAALERGDLPPDAYRALEIRALLSAANVKKLRTLKHQVSRDGRLRNQYMYCGADRTGRWSAGGVQLQNITAKGPKIAKCDACGGLFSDRPAEATCPRCGAAGAFWRSAGAWSVEAVKQAKQDIKARDLDRLIQLWGDPISVLCGCLRGLFIAKPGYKLICVDYSSIEAVVTACLAGCQWRIDVFNGHGNIYAASAAAATGIPLEEILAYKKQHGVHHPARNGIGKVRELAGGFGGWINAWKNFGADKYFENDEAIKQDVLKWRAESPEIVEMWGGQYRQVGPRLSDAIWQPYGLEGMAVLACLNPGQMFRCRDIVFLVRDDILYCQLPSGRYLHYHRPRLEPDTDFLRRSCWRITFECYNSNPTKGPMGWHRFDTYSGRLFENIVQATARDVQALAMVRAEKAGYPVVMHTHDELTTEVAEGSVQRLIEVMIERPEWARDWPIKAAGWEDYLYQKD